MNRETLLTTIDRLSSEEREPARNHLTQQDQTRLEEVDRIMTDPDTAVNEFWGDSTQEEMQAIFAAMRTKNPPLENEL